MKKDAGIERREQKRADVELDIDLSTYGKYYLSKLLNVSIGGAFIRSRELQPVGTELKIKFSLPGQVEAIQAVAKVAWTYRQPGAKEPNSSGMGVQFTKLSEEDRAKIKSFIDGV